MEKITKHKASSQELLGSIQTRFEQDHGKPGPEDAEFLDNLRKEGFKITETHKGERFADSVDESGFKKLNESERWQLHILAVAAEKYYFGVLIEDPFDNEAREMGLVGAAAVAEATDRRRDYQTRMLKNPVYSRMESQSKFRLGTITGLWTTLTKVVDELDSRSVTTPQANVLRELQKKLPTIHEPRFKYTNMPHEEKVEVVNQMDEIAGEILHLLRPLAQKQ